MMQYMKWTFFILLVTIGPETLAKEGRFIADDTYTMHSWTPWVDDEPSDSMCKPHCVWTQRRAVFLINAKLDRVSCYEIIERNQNRDSFSLTETNCPSYSYHKQIRMPHHGDKR